MNSLVSKAKNLCRKVADFEITDPVLFMLLYTYQLLLSLSHFLVSAEDLYAASNLY